MATEINMPKTPKLLLGTVALMSMLPGAASAQVTWLHHTVTNGLFEWSGGPPMDGLTSDSNVWSDNTQNPPSVVSETWGSVGRVGMNYSVLMEDDPGFEQFNLNANAAYTARWPNGDPDPSTRDFRYRVDLEAVFNMSANGSLNCYPLAQNMGPFALCKIERGTYSSGVFTPGSLVIDMTTTSGAVPVSAGDYRISASIDAIWQANSNFARNNGIAVDIHPVPEPASIIALGAGMAAIIRRRIRK